MATTNKMIIAIACQENNIAEPVATYEQWKHQGFQVKRGIRLFFNRKQNSGCGWECRPWKGEKLNKYYLY